MQITTIGLDLAKSVFQVHGVDDAGQVIVRRKLRRAEVLKFFGSLPPCLVGMEACATAHFWTREIAALGHQVRLMPPSYVKAYVRRQKNDAADAEAICEAVTRPTMRFVPIKRADRQGVLVLHRTRELLVRQRTMLINAIRGHCAEFGIIAPQGARRAGDLVEQIRRADVAVLGGGIPTAMRQLDLRYLHLKHGRTGILDYTFERYLKQGAPAGLTFLESVESPTYDPAEIKAGYAARPRRSLLADLIGRE